MSKNSQFEECSIVPLDIKGSLAGISDFGKDIVSQAGSASGSISSHDGSKNDTDSDYNTDRGGLLPYIDYTGMCRWPGYGFQAFEFRTGYINQENNVGNEVYNYIKLINSLIQVAINFLERHMTTYRIRVILSSALIRVSSLEQGVKTKLNLV